MFNDCFITLIRQNLRVTFPSAIGDGAKSEKKKIETSIVIVLEFIISKVSGQSHLTL